MSKLFASCCKCWSWTVPRSSAEALWHLALSSSSSPSLFTSIQRLQAATLDDSHQVSRRRKANNGDSPDREASIRNFSICVASLSLSLLIPHSSVAPVTKLALSESITLLGNKLLSFFFSADSCPQFDQLRAASFEWGLFSVIDIWLAQSGGVQSAHPTTPR